MERKSGFYWVKLDDEWDEWIVARWDSKFNWWDIPGWYDTLRDNEFDSINENRIIPPDEWE